MGAEPLIRPAGKLYEEDFVEWAGETARLLRSGRFGEIDVEHLVEEVEAMPSRDRRELRSRLKMLMVHLLKWKFQPERRSGSWKSTIDDQREEIEDLFDESPSLRQTLPAATLVAYRRAVTRASSETALPANSFPAECPFSVAQILDPEFLP